MCIKVAVKHKSSSSSSSSSSLTFSGNIVYVVISIRAFNLAAVEEDPFKTKSPDNEVSSSKGFTLGQIWS